MTNSKLNISEKEYRNARIDMVSVSYSIAERAQRARENTVISKLVLFAIFSVLVIAQIVCEIFFPACITFHIICLAASVVCGIIGGCIDGVSMDHVNNDYYAMGQAFYQYAISMFIFAMILIYVF